MPPTRRIRNARKRLDPRREIHIDQLTSGPSRGWIHTHGLAAHGLPELEIRDVPLFLGSGAAHLLNELADYLLNDATKPLLAGQTIHWGKWTIQVVEAEPDEAGGYDPGHYLDTRLRLVDPDDTSGMCDECAKELARRPALLS